MEVTIYSTPNCQYCKNAKEFFNSHSVSFTEHDVSSDQERRQEMIDLTGQMGVPVIRISDDENENVFVGFTENQDNLRQALDIDSQE